MRRSLAMTALIATVLTAGCWPDGGSEDTTARPVGLVQLIEFQGIQGLRNWGYELQQRGLRSLVFVQKNMLETWPVEIRWLADAGHEIAGGYAEQPFWDVPYETQLDIMRQTRDAVEQVTGKPMRVFGSKYFAYDANTLAAADALGIQYVLARGTSDVEAIIYDPDEYDCKIISVSNVTFEDMGRGSLCDYSLWARGSTAEQFAEIIEQSLAKSPKRIMLACHTYLGGMKKAWWEVYRDVLDSGKVRWAADFDEWAAATSGVNLQLPMSLIPANREVKYDTPAPSTPLDELADVDQMHNPCGAP
ncbi:MAG TPA: polysaccharide deacetylase family protein [Phycisphaerae bacterium]|nr:polysaccharide deacetylase family protein [Phycisphaerae bacterium]HOJ72472.1 polysaccharide deacetylase family protein [Phycisphaerae bacterium]HOM49866.1 polysaccharide deacetylase family protein [Phycisphaerae bacterium]HON67777.1 polysaccharide deacetylase family protein [Phycisphaerae bacterium]HOQ84720.1 polysaccharide deacetylase family protein [Phycisphaerae bacterium]